MQKVDIQLPPHGHVDLWDFTRLIAKSICPSLREAKKHTWIQNKLESVHGTEFESRSAMSPQERQLLLRLLPGLPVRAGMSEGDRQRFMDAFMSHAERPSWRPIFASEEEVTANALEILKIQEDYLLALRHEIETGRISAFDQHHLPETRVGRNIFIGRADALSFLRQRHLRVTESPSPEPPASASRPASKSNDLPHTAAEQPEQENLSPDDAVSVLARGERVPPLPRTSTVNSVQDGASIPRKRTKKAAPQGSSTESIEQAGQHPNTPLVILRRKQVEERTSLSRSAIYDRLDPHSPRYDPTFPKQIKLSASSSGWVEAEIDHWLRMRLSARA